MWHSLRRRHFLSLAVCVLLMGCATTPDTDDTAPRESESASLARSLREAGDVALRNGSPRTALGAYMQVAQIEPKNADAFARMAVAYRQLDALPAASSAIQRAVQLRPDDAHLLETAGLLMTDIHQWELASQYLQHAFEKGANSWKTLNALGICADMQGNPAVASTYYTQAIALQPSALLYNNQGYSLYMAQNYAAATKSFEAALQLEPANRLAWRNLALVRMRQGNLDEALHAAFKGGDIHSALNDIGYIAMLDGQATLAKFFFEQAIEMAPTKHYARAEQNLQRLAQPSP